MGKKKWCFGREDVICLTKDCKYMSDCIQVVWQNKMTRLVGRGREAGSQKLPKLKSTLRKEDQKKRKVTSTSQS